MNKRIMKKIALIGSLASIIGLILYLLPKKATNNIELNKNNDGNTIVQGNSNQIDQSTNYNIQVGEKRINKLYPSILVDYYGSSEKKIKQDFGEPKSELLSTEGLIGYGIESDKHKAISYSFEEGGITFYINKETLHASALMATKTSNEYNLMTPFAQNIVLGKITFKDIFNSFPTPENIYTNNGKIPGATYTEAEFYLGRAGNYATLTFGITDFSPPEINKNIDLINDKRPNYLIIQ